MATLVENQLAQAMGRLAEEFKIRADVERDYRAACYYIALEMLRVRWEADAWPAEAIEAGDRR